MKPVFWPKPFELVTLTDPEEPVPTTAEIVVEFTTVKEAAGVKPKETEVVPIKFVPVIVTVCPWAAAVGEKEETFGEGAA